MYVVVVPADCTQHGARRSQIPAVMRMKSADSFAMHCIDSLVVARQTLVKAVVCVTLNFYFLYSGTDLDSFRDTFFVGTFLRLRKLGFYF